MAAEIGRLVKRLTEVPREAVFPCVDRFKEIATAEANSDRMPFRNRGRGPTAFETITYDGDDVSVVLKGSPAGPWSWLENGVPPHAVGLARSMRRSGSSKGNYRAAVSTPDGPRAISTASFPKKGTWTRVVDRFESEIDEILSGVVDEAIG